MPAMRVSVLSQPGKVHQQLIALNNSPDILHDQDTTCVFRAHGEDDSYKDSHVAVDYDQT